MDTELLRTHWALAAGAVALILAGGALLARKAAASGPARLRRARRRLAEERRRLARAQRALTHAEAALERLASHAQKVKPRLLDEARGTLEDARALARIARDQVQIAENHVRIVICEEFAPAQQQRLREKYLPETPPDRRPFSF